MWEHSVTAFSCALKKSKNVFLFGSGSHPVPPLSDSPRDNEPVYMERCTGKRDDLIHFAILEHFWLVFSYVKIGSFEAAQAILACILGYLEVGPFLN